MYLRAEECFLQLRAENQLPIPALCGTQHVITLFASGHHYYLSSDRWPVRSRFPISLIFVFYTICPSESSIWIFYVISLNIIIIIIIIHYLVCTGYLYTYPYT